MVGCTGVAHTPLFLLSTGDGIRRVSPNLLWIAGELDCLLDQLPLCGVQI